MARYATVREGVNANTTTAVVDGLHGSLPVVPSAVIMAVDPRQHQRYLAYLKKYEYFGQGRRKLGWDEFVALESEVAASDGPAQSVERNREAVKLLLKD